MERPMTEVCLTCRRTGGLMISGCGVYLSIRAFSTQYTKAQRSGMLFIGPGLVLAGIYHGWVATYLEEVCKLYIFI